MYRVILYRNRYAIEYTRGGARKRVSLRTADRGEAEARASEFWEQLNKPQSKRVGDLWPMYLAHQTKRGIDTKRLPSFWRQLEPKFAHLYADGITEDHCERYTAERLGKGLSTATPRLELTYLRGCLKWAEKKGYIDKAPHIWMPQAAEPRDYYLTKAQFAKALDHAETPHIRLFMILGITTGARMSSILQLQWHGVDLERGLVNFHPFGGRRTNKRRPTVPLNDIAVKALRDAHRAALTDWVIEYNEKPLKSVKRGLEGVVKRSGVLFTAHVLRHSFGVWLAEAGTPMEEIAQMLGDSLPITIKHYARYSPGYLKKAASAADWNV